MEIIASWLEMLGFGGFLVSIIMWRINKMDKSQRAREAARISENIIIMRGLQAIGNLSEASAIAIKLQKCNGETDRSLAEYGLYKHDLNNYLLNQNALRNEGK